MAEYVEGYVYVCSVCKKIEKIFSKKDMIRCLICRAPLCSRCEKHSFCPEHFQGLTLEDQKSVEEIDKAATEKGQVQFKRQYILFDVTGLFCLVSLIISIALGQWDLMWIGVISLFIGFCVFFSGKSLNRRTKEQKLPIAQKYRQNEPNSLTQGNK